MNLPSERPRGLIGCVQAMARPRCDAVERDRVLFLARSENGSKREIARRLAETVVQAFLSLDRLEEPLARDLLHAERILADDAAYAAATAERGAFDLFAELRHSRFAERGCRQLRPLEWDAETNELAEVVVDRLSRRFRDYLREWP